MRRFTIFTHHWILLIIIAKTDLFEPQPSSENSARYYQGDTIKVDVMSGACTSRMNRSNEKEHRIFVGKPHRNYLDDIHVNGKTVLKWILKGTG
jgi:hypothetical protein